MIRALNVVTNLSYAVAGGLLAWLYQGALPISVFAGTIVLTYGSSIYHATVHEGEPNSADSQRPADILGIYFTFCPLAAWGIHAAFGLPEVHLALGSFIVWMVLAWHRDHLESFVVIGVLGIVIVACLFIHAPAWAGFPILLYGLALLMWMVDRPGPGLLHAAWHLATALAIFFTGFVFAL